MSDKTPVQADGRGSADKSSDRGQLGSVKRRSTESSGGPYPNPKTDDETDKGDEDFGTHGGQSHIEYEGPDNPNATTKGG